MPPAAFIDLILTPIAYGAGAIIGLSWGVRRQPEKFQVVSKLGIRLLFGVAVALASFALRVM